MIEFKPITLDDAAWARPLFEAENSPSADHNFVNVYCWQGSFISSIARIADRAAVRIDGLGRTIFSYPLGSGALIPVIDALREYAKEIGIPFIMRGVTDVQRETLDALFPGHFEYEEETSAFDYVYLASRLSTYSGKALHSKKNHCNRFEAENDWRFVPLTKELIPECMEMLEHWKLQNAERLSDSIRHEYTVIDRAMDGFDALGLEGGVLYSGDRVVGFTYGSFTTPDTLDVHVEKADISINGAYPMVCREFVRMMMNKYPSLKYINREDDMGLDYLRQSKRSYKPEFLLKKYRARWTDAL